MGRRARVLGGLSGSGENSIHFIADHSVVIGTPGVNIQAESTPCRPPGWR